MHCAGHEGPGRGGWGWGYMVLFTRNRRHKYFCPGNVRNVLFVNRWTQIYPHAVVAYYRRLNSYMLRGAPCWGGSTVLRGEHRVEGSNVFRGEHRVVEGSSTMLLRGAAACWGEHRVVIQRWSGHDLLFINHGFTHQSILSCLNLSMCPVILTFIWHKYIMFFRRCFASLAFETPKTLHSIHI